MVLQFSTPGCSRYVKTVDCGQKCLNTFSIQSYIFPQHNENIIILPWSASETSYLLCCSQGSQGCSAAVNKTINSVTSARITGVLPGHRAQHFLSSVERCFLCHYLLSYVVSSIQKYIALFWIMQKLGRYLNWFIGLLIDRLCVTTSHYNTCTNVYM